MDGPDAIMDDPLPTPTGPNLLALMGEQQPPLSQSAAAPSAALPAAAPGAGLGPLGGASPPQQQQQQAVRQRQQPGMSALEKEACLIMLNLLTKYKEAEPFRNPVDVHQLNIPDYFDVVKQPMDLKTVRSKVRADDYSSMEEWEADMDLIWHNAKLYNGEDHPVTKAAEKLQANVKKRMPEALLAAEAALAAAERNDAKARSSSKGKIGNKELVALLGSSTPVSDDDSQDDMPLPLLPRRAASTDRLNGTVSDGVVQQRSPDPPRLSLKRPSTADGDFGGGGAAAAGVGSGPSGGKALRRKLASTPGPTAAGADVESLEALTNTPAAKQLGIADADDLAFLAVWKRVIARKQQLQREATETDSLRRSNAQLRASLATAEESTRELERSLQTETAAKQAAEERATTLTRQLATLQAQYKQQEAMLENQRKLLEQQQTVLRKLARQQQHAGDTGPSGAGGSAPAAAAQSAVAPA